MFKFKKFKKEHKPYKERSKLHEISLKVIEAEEKDLVIGKNVVRAHVNIMEKLGLNPGDIVEIRGRSITAAIIQPFSLEDQNPYTIRMSSLVRRNAGVLLGEEVIVKKAEVKYAKLIKLAPSLHRITIEPGFVDYVKRRLIGYPLVEGDRVLVPLLGGALPFTVVMTDPSGVVIVNKDTKMSILERLPLQACRIRATYKDVGGMKETIKSIHEIVELTLKHPEVFEHLKIRPIQGILLYGEPGTGKTLLVSALANEMGAQLITINGSELLIKRDEEIEIELKEAFEKAKKYTPSIIFIDNIDVLAPSHGKVTSLTEKRSLNTLLTLLDELENHRGVVVIGAARDIEAVNDALRRPGRFDLEIKIPLPDSEGRYEILQIHTRNLPLERDVDLKRLAEITKGYSGADIELLIKLTIINAIQRLTKSSYMGLSKNKAVYTELLKELKLSMSDFLKAVEELNPIVKRRRSLSK
ncbi:MAG: hypothetical protein B6U76_03280 [Desulfurococcales archaeon ex4484_217_2]|nr:MAG: hypothetical protein B6U76_03280 [Desulfurococcales archaeon ex4484_217_2]